MIVELKEIGLQLCPCTSGQNYLNCCKPYHEGNVNAPTPEKLMRSRFSAYALNLIDYLIKTTHPSVRHLYSKAELTKWATHNTWLKLEIVEAQCEVVEFKAYFHTGEHMSVHHELSTFKLTNKIWYYLDGKHFD